MREWAFKDNFAGAIIGENTGKKLEYRDLIKRPELQQRWSVSLSDKLGRLSQGICDIPGPNTIMFIQKANVPTDRRKEVTYGRIVVVYKPDKLKMYRSRLIVGSNRTVCLVDSSSLTADLPTTKMVWNSVLSTPGTK